MSRIAKNPVLIPRGVEAKFASGDISIKGPKGTLEATIHPLVELEIASESISVKFDRNNKSQVALAGYRAQAKGQVLNLSLGFSHPVDYEVPPGITVETPSQTEIVVKGCDKQKVGQVAANIRAYRPPEPYKGKGVRYADEVIIRKEAKKK